ncbi:MAG: DUF3048 domain-containing protein [Actinomycetia bacterium]|nr:DUF3048 domain-containing protein [Actinomycetes bacterium]
MRSFTKNIFIKLIIVSMALAMALTFSIYGCSGQEPVEQQPQDEQPAEEESSGDKQPAEGQEEQEQEEGTEGGLHQKIITGNINILSGLEISEQINDSRPIAVMIENSPDSRPQSGLSLADVVFEIVDEGGVTRYVAIYSSYDAEKLGPVRSARQYYGEVARSFDPIYAFWGTYPEGYKLIENMGMDVLSVLGDQSGNSSITAQASHWRDDSRVAPHNGYMSTLQLKEDAQRLGYAVDGGQSPFMFKLDAPLSERGTIDQVTVDFSYEQYKAVYEYDSENNNYLKYVGNAAHMDRETGEQIVASNIVVMITDIANSGDDAGHMIVRTTNGGKAFFFMDGEVIEGTWDRKSVSEPFDFKDDQGNDILFNRGTTWISMVESVDRVIY